MEQHLEAILVPLSFFVLVGFILSQSRRRAEHETQRRFELGVKTLERFSDPEALERFLSSVAGQEFMRLLDSGEAPIYRRLLRSIQAGLALCGLGLAFLVLTPFQGEDLLIPGVILTFLGGSLLGGAAVARTLSRRWDILGDGRGRNSRGQSPYREASA